MVAKGNSCIRCESYSWSVCKFPERIPAFPQSIIFHNGSILNSLRRKTVLWYPVKRVWLYCLSSKKLGKNVARKFDTPVYKLRRTLGCSLKVSCFPNGKVYSPESSSTAFLLNKAIFLQHTLIIFKEVESSIALDCLALPMCLVFEVQPSPLLFWLEEFSKRLLFLAVIQRHSSIKNYRPVTSLFPLGHLSRPPCHQGPGLRGTPHLTPTLATPPSQHILNLDTWRPDVIRTRSCIVETLDQLSHGFVRGREIQFKALPEDVEGDALFDLGLINLTHLSATPAAS